MKKNRHVAFALSLIFYCSLLPWSAGAEYLRTNASTLIVKESPYADIRAFGAVSDTQTTAVMTANVVAIQAALDYAKTNGVPVFIPHGVWHTNGALLAQDHYVDELRMFGTGRSTIYGHDIAGPVINIGGSIAKWTSINIYADNCYYGVVAYRTTTYSGAFGSFINCKFAGTATRAMFYAIAYEVVSFIDCHTTQQSNAPGYLDANRDVLNDSASLPSLNTDSAYGAAGESNTVKEWRGGSMVNLPLVTSTADSIGFRIRQGSRYVIDGVSFTRDNLSRGIVLGNSDGESLDSVTVVNCREESNPTGGAFIYVTGTNMTVGHLTAKWNQIHSAIPIVYMDNGTTLVSADIGPNWGATGTTYRYANFNYGFHYDTRIAASFTGSTADLSPVASVIKAKNITYGAAGGKSYNAQVSEYDSVNDIFWKEYTIYKQLSADPIYSLTANHYGTIAVPDGSGWNPTGIDNTPHYPVLSAGAIKWVTPPFISSLTAPSDNTTACKKGQMWFDDAAIYWCYSDNNIRRAEAGAW